jgi:hypothetical protein
MDSFDLTKRNAAFGDATMPLGVFTKPTGRELGLGDVQMPVLMREGSYGQFADRPELEKLLMMDEQYSGLLKALQDVRSEGKSITDELVAAESQGPFNAATNQRTNQALKFWEEQENLAAEKARARATEILQGDGLTGIRVKRDEGAGVKPVDTTLVFDPKNVRSRYAAFDPDNIDKPSLLGMGRAAVDSDLIKLLMAYGAFGGMSAGALATIDGQKQQGSGF